MGRKHAVVDVVLPQMGLEVSEGTIVSLHVDVGAVVAEGDPLLEVETDKALTDVVAPSGGTVAEFAVEVGDTVPVGAVLVRLGGDGEEPPAPARGESEAAPVREERVLVAAGAETARGAHTIKAAPVARRAARHHGIELTAITGTGPRGRITLGDVEKAVAGRATNGNDAAAPQTGGERLEPMSPTRRAIARRMTESARIPQFTLERDIDATWLLAEKARITAETPVRTGVNDLLVQALAETAGRHPALATSYVEPQDGGHPQLRRRDGVDVGLAVATDRGLLVPVIRGAHERTLGETAIERARLVSAARAGKLELAEMTGGTVSLSSLSSFGVDRFTAMLNPGESAILAVGRTVDRVVPRDRGLAVIPSLTLTLTLDHRVVDGATGADALAELAELLEGGMAWRT